MKNKIIKNYSNAYSEKYYSHRKGNDLKRQKSFKQEEKLIKKYISRYRYGFRKIVYGYPKKKINIRN